MIIELYRNIKLRRQQLGLTQEDLANRVGYSDKSMISKVEHGGIDLSQTQVVKFAEALETTPAALMGWDKDTTSFNYDNRPHKTIPSIADYKVDLPNSAHSVFIGAPDNGKTPITSYYYSLLSLLAKEQIARLLLAAAEADPDQIEMAINLLNYKKENK